MAKPVFDAKAFLEGQKRFKEGTFATVDPGVYLCQLVGVETKYSQNDNFMAVFCWKIDENSDKFPNQNIWKNMILMDSPEETRDIQYTILAQELSKLGYEGSSDNLQEMLDTVNGAKCRIKVKVNEKNSDFMDINIIGKPIEYGPNINIETLDQERDAVLDTEKILDSHENDEESLKVGYAIQMNNGSVWKILVIDEVNQAVTARKIDSDEIQVIKLKEITSIIEDSQAIVMEKEYLDSKKEKTLERPKTTIDKAAGVKDEDYKDSELDELDDEPEEIQYKIGQTVTGIGGNALTTISGPIKKIEKDFVKISHGGFLKKIMKDKLTPF